MREGRSFTATSPTSGVPPTRRSRAGSRRGCVPSPCAHRGDPGGAASVLRPADETLGQVGSRIIAALVLSIALAACASSSGSASHDLSILRSQPLAYYGPAGATVVRRSQPLTHTPGVSGDHATGASLAWNIQDSSQARAATIAGLRRRALQLGWTVGADVPGRAVANSRPRVERSVEYLKKVGGRTLRLGCLAWSDTPHQLDCVLAIPSGL